jgi:hypothetical protein
MIQVSNSTSWRVLASTALLAASVLALEIALTRVFSVLTWHHFTYMVISISLLGFGAAGSWTTIKCQSDPEVLRPRRLARSALAYAVAVVVSFGLTTQVHFEL